MDLSRAYRQKHRWDEEIVRLETNDMDARLPPASRVDIRKGPFISLVDTIPTDSYAAANE